jgi:hypothetical protein
MVVECAHHVRACEAGVRNQPISGATCAVASQSYRQLRTYLPGGRCDGTLTTSRTAWKWSFPMHPSHGGLNAGAGPLSQRLQSLPGVPAHGPARPPRVRACARACAFARACMRVYLGKARKGRRPGCSPTAGRRWECCRCRSAPEGIEGQAMSAASESSTTCSPSDRFLRSRRHRRRGPVVHVRTAGHACVHACVRACIAHTIVPFRSTIAC